MTWQLICCKSVSLCREIPSHNSINSVLGVITGQGVEKDRRGKFSTPLFFTSRVDWLPRLGYSVASGLELLAVHLYKRLPGTLQKAS